MRVGEGSNGVFLGEEEADGENGGFGGRVEEADGFADVAADGELREGGRIRKGQARADAQLTASLIKAIFHSPTPTSRPSFRNDRVGSAGPPAGSGFAATTMSLAEEKYPFRGLASSSGSGGVDGPTPSLAISAARRSGAGDDSRRPYLVGETSRLPGLLGWRLVGRLALRSLPLRDVEKRLNERVSGAATPSTMACRDCVIRARGCRSYVLIVEGTMIENAKLCDPFSSLIPAGSPAPISMVRSNSSRSSMSLPGGCIVQVTRNVTWILTATRVSRITTSMVPSRIESSRGMSSSPSPGGWTSTTGDGTWMVTEPLCER